MVPQPVQHVVIADAARRAGGAIVFYTMEDHYTTSTHEVVLKKLEEQPSIDGIVFFRLAQFFHDGRPQFRILRQIVAAGYVVIFARERLVIATEAELEGAFPLLFACGYLEGRDADRGAFAKLISAAL